MRKNHFILILFVFFQTMLFSQEIHFYTGMNFTNYDFKNGSTNSNVNLQSGKGFFYDIGFKFSSNNEKFKYEAGFNLNQYNAIVVSDKSTYPWQTDYFGGKFTALYSFINNEQFDISLNGGINLSTILNSKQEENGIYYDLINTDVFSGVWLQPTLGVQFKYFFTTKFHFSLGYNFYKSFNVSNSTADKLSFTNHQLQFGVHYTWED